MRKVLVLCALAVLAASCRGGGDQRASATPTPTAVPVKESFENVLPKPFPGDFPLPEDRTIVYSLTSDKTVVFFNSTASYGDIRSFMLSKLPEAGWPIAFCGQLSNPVTATFLTAAKGARAAQVIVGFIAEPKPGVKEYKFIVEIAKGPATTTRPEQFDKCA